MRPLVGRCARECAALARRFREPALHRRHERLAGGILPDAVAETIVTARPIDDGGQRSTNHGPLKLAQRLWRCIDVHPICTRASVLPLT